MDSLVTTAWLAERLGTPNLVILDASLHLPAAKRDAAAEFEAAHIPGARFLDLASFRDIASPLANTVPTPAQAAARLSELGLERSHRVILYDDSVLRSAARAWFLLRGFGFCDVAILDGGLAKWRAEGLPLEAGVAPLPAASVAPMPFDRRLRDKAQMLALVGGGDEQIVDARDPGRFTGATVDPVHGLPGGHMPGARNLFYGDVFAADGTYKPAEELRDVFAAAGIDLARPIVTTCGSGVTAAAVLFALHLLGVSDAALYDGSWSEWGADPTTPKAVGPA